MFRLEDYRELVGDRVLHEIYRKARKLYNKRIIHVNSTYTGGGVAEILNSLVPMFNEIGLYAGWRIFHGYPDFFSVTKKMHNALQGQTTNFNKEELDLYRATNKAYSVYTHINHDVAFIHDPQPLPMIDYYRKSQPWVWRCLSDSYIITENGFEYIEDFDIKSGINNFITTLLGIDDYVDSKLITKRKEKTIKIKTDMGYELEGTENHPILCWTNNCELIFKEIKDIKIDDYVVINRKFPYIQNEDMVSPDIARLLGYMVADGNFTKNGIEIGNIRDYIFNDVKKIGQSLGIEFYINGTHIVSNIKKIKDLIFELCDLPNNWIARYKYIPSIILKSSKTIQSNFLYGYLNCDSGFSGHEFTTSSISEKLSKQIHLLLLNFGIISRRKKEKDKFKIFITGKELDILKNTIGYIKYNIPDKTHNTNKDIIPFLREYLNIEKWRLNSNNFSWDKFKLLVDNISNDKISFTNGKFLYLNDTLRNSVNGIYNNIKNFYFDKIKYIEYHNEKYVYDFHVPKREYFWSNGFISHNCHIDISKPTPTLDYLKQFILKYDKMIISSNDYVMDGFPVEYSIIQPAIDPSTLKNRQLTDYDISRCLNKFGIPTDKPIIAQVSRFDKWKQPGKVLDIFRKVKSKIDCRLVLCGSMASDDPEGLEIYEDIKRKAEDLNGDVFMTTVESNMLVNSLQSIADVIIQFSSKEGFGLTVTEAMFKQKPVISTKVGGIVLQIEDEKNGFLVEPDDVNGCADRVIEILQNKKLAEEIGKNARRSVIDKFLMTRLLTNYLDLITEILNS